MYVPEIVISCLGNKTSPYANLMIAFLNNEPNFMVEISANELYDEHP